MTEYRIHFSLTRRDSLDFAAADEQAALDALGEMLRIYRSNDLLRGVVVVDRVEPLDPNRNR